MFYNLEGTQAFVAALLHQLCYKAELRKREEPLHPGNVLSVKPANTDQIPATSSGREFWRFLPFESESKNDQFTENDKVYFPLFFFKIKKARPHPWSSAGSLAIRSLALLVTIILSAFGLRPLGANGSRARLIVIRALTAGFTCRIFTPQSSLILAAQLIKRLDTGGEERGEREGGEDGGEGEGWRRGEVFLNYRKTPTRGKSLASLAEENRSGRSKSLALAYCTCYH